MMPRKVVNRRTFLKATGGTAGIGLIAGCSSGGGGGSDDGGDSGGDGGGDSGGDGGEMTTTSGSDDGGSGAINIGSVQPLSGNFAPWGQTHSAGLAFGVQEINSNGGVLDGRELNIVEADSASDPAEAASIFERFAEQDGIAAATGPVSSDVGIRTSRTAQELGIPMFMHMAGSNDTITPETRHSFRVGLVPATPTAQAQAGLAADRGYENVAAIVGDYAWGRSMQSGIQNNFDIDVNIQVAPVSQSDFSSYVRQISEDVEMVIASGHPPGSLSITGQLYELGRSPDVVTGPSFPPNVIRSALGENANRGFTHVHLSDPYSDEFAEVATRFAEANGAQFNTHTAYGYVTAQLIAQAIEDAGEADPQAITEATRAIEFDTLFANPIQYADSGELENQIQLYSSISLDAPSYYPDGNYSYEEVFRTDPLPAIAAAE
ncbi:ABC transporter substrate-binding protein [Halobellus sp. MBLA0160]|uniref:ABC transporter substrate-binding protein n=2 Tax=Halobellus ruber TaxID=2761102 RepID=A0A7J9SHD4_9EURY|nr:ABC transporter substrate-binding protein [Halobellus ruber]